jgi:hypothetical protein
MTQPFWKPQPALPGEDWIAPWLKWSLRVSTIGWIIYGVFALAFDDIQVIHSTVQSWLVIIGSGLIVAGAEMNTGPTVVAVSRKWGAGKGQRLDAIAFIVSLIGSITAGLIAFSIRQTRLGETGWRALALDYGPLVVGVAIACDFYAAGVELGLLKADYEREMEQWLRDKRAWEQEHGTPPRPEPRFDPKWPRATLNEWRTETAGLNGGTPQTIEEFERFWSERERNVPPQSTAKRWLRMGRGG